MVSKANVKSPPPTGDEMSFITGIYLVFDGGTTAVDR